MLTLADFSIASGGLTVKNDRYELRQINDVRLITHTLSSQVLKATVTSVIASSILWVFEPFTTPWGVTIHAGLLALGLTFPVVLWFSIARAKYQLQVEFEHQDDVGLQWVTVASGRTEQEFATFQCVEQALMRALAPLTRNQPGERQSLIGESPNC